MSYLKGPYDAQTSLYGGQGRDPTSQTCTDQVRPGSCHVPEGQGVKGQIGRISHAQGVAYTESKIEMKSTTNALML